MLLSWHKKLSWPVVAIAASAFFLFGLVFALHRYYSFYADFDQGIFNQVFWNSVHGRFFQSSLSSSLSTNVVHDHQVPQVFYHRLGQHFTPALLLWLPLYALFPSPATLTVLQVTLITAAGLVLYALARIYLPAALAVLITLSYYGANAVIGPTLCNFHDICQMPLFVFGLLWAMEKRHWWLYALLAVLTLAIREDAGVVLFGVGFYLTASKRYPRIGLATCIASFGYMVLLTNWIMPLFSEDISRRFMIERFGQYAQGNAEASTLDIIWGILSNPLRLIGEIVTPVSGTVRYLLGQALPLGFVPFVSPSAWAIAGFPLLKLFLAQGQTVLSLNVRHALIVVPGFFYGAILWWSKQLAQPPHAQKKSRLKQVWIAGLVLSLMLGLTSNPNRTFSFVIPDSINPWVYISLPRRWEHAQAIKTLLPEIPEQASVAATTYIVPHLSGRREILRFPMNLQLENDAKQVVNVEYCIADLWMLQQYQVAFKRDREQLRMGVTLIEQMLGSRTYGVIGFADGVILLQTGQDSEPEALAAWRNFRQEIDEFLKPQV